MPNFLLDSNFFIQAHRIIYPLDVVTGFWNKVKELASEEKIISIDKVKNEIYKNEDELKKWMNVNLSPQFFKDSQLPEVLVNYSKIVHWAQARSDFYIQRALTDFLEYENADSWLVAYALTLNKDCILVTQEVSQPNRKSSIKIPDVCNAFGIQAMNTIEMFRILKETF